MQTCAMGLDTVSIAGLNGATVTHVLTTAFLVPNLQFLMSRTATLRFRTLKMDCVNPKNPMEIRATLMCSASPGIALTVCVVTCSAAVFARRVTYQTMWVPVHSSPTIPTRMASADCAEFAVVAVHAKMLPRVKTQRTIAAKHLPILADSMEYVMEMERATTGLGARFAISPSV